MKAVMLVRAYNEETKERGEVACLEVPKPELVHGDDVLIKVAYASVRSLYILYLPLLILSFSI